MYSLLTHPVVYFFIALLITLAGTPLARKIALRYNIVDKPDARKIHMEPTPYLGGLFIFIALIIAGIPAYNNLLTIEPVAAWYLIAAFLVIIFEGMYDDLWDMPAGYKMMLIGVAATILYLGGFSVEFTPWHVINYPLTLFWFLGITNAANLMDNMNGLASGCGVISALFLAYLAYLRADPMIMGFAFILAGAYLGFMKYNFPKAKIFLGDTGSVILGFSLATLGLMVGRHTGIMNTLAPIYLVGIFIFDTFFVAFSRWVRKIHFWEGAGMDHTSHRFVSLGFTKKNAVMMVWSLNAIFGLNAIILWKSSLSFGIPLAIVLFILLIVFGLWLDKVPIIQKEEPKPSTES